MGLFGLLNILTIWDANYELLPRNANSPTRGDDSVRGVKTANEERMHNEHNTYNDGTGGDATLDWRHKEGSARAWYQSAAPTNAPNSGDLQKGHLWWDSDDDKLYVNAATGSADWDELGYPALGDNETITGTWTFNNALTLNGGAKIGDAGTIVKTKVLSAAMAGEATKDITHGLTYTDIRGLALTFNRTSGVGYLDYYRVNATDVQIALSQASTGTVYVVVFYAP